MGKFLKDSTAIRMLNSIDFTESFPQGRRAQNRRVIRTIAAGSVRSYIEITSVKSASEYTGNVLEFPGGEAIKEGIAIEVIGAASNEYQVGYSTFADKAKNSDGDEVYFIDGYLLG